VADLSWSERGGVAAIATRGTAPPPAPPSSPPVSIVIRARDEAAALPGVLAMLARQTVAPAELLLIDSGSTDATIEIARAHGARVLVLAPEQFTYGRALNLGTRAAHGAIVVYLSAHAEPVGPDWLAELIAPLADPSVAGVFGRQLPRPGCHAIEAHELERAYPDREQRFRQPAPFSNANAAVRRALALEQPFDEQVGYAEDRIWAAGIAARGLQIAYAPSAAVLHSHDDGALQVLRRKRRETAEMVRRLGLDPGLRHAALVPIGWLVGTVKDAGRLLRRRAPLRDWLRAPAQRLARVAGVWLGCRDARR
jgi:rhamnosyltransferase